MVLDTGRLPLTLGRVGDHPGRTQGGTQGKRPAVTISEAAKLCGVSRDIIKRKLHAAAFPNAHQRDDRSKTWVIPITDLGAAGLKPGGPSNGTQPTPAAVDEGGRAHLEQRVAELEHRLAVVAGERDTWRARAEEREKALELAGLALRRVPELETSEQQQRRRRWWQSR